MSGKQYQAMYHDGETGKVTPVSRPTTAAKAQEIAQAERAQRLHGSSDWTTVREVKK